MQQIIEIIGTKYHGTALRIPVSAILGVYGYTIRHYTPSANGGVDMVAGKDPLGFGQPRLCVQVEAGDQPVDLQCYDRLRKDLRSFGAEHGLLVSLGGFTKSVHDRNEQQFFEIRLWGPEQLAERLLERYDALPPDIRAEIPLDTVRILRETD